MPPPRVISTLCPKRLQPSDCIDISGLWSPTIALPYGTARAYLALPQKNTLFLRTHAASFTTTPLLKLRPLSVKSASVAQIVCKISPTARICYRPTSLTPGRSPYPIKPPGQLILDGLTSQTTLGTWVMTKARYGSYHMGPTCRPILYEVLISESLIMDLQNLK